VSVFGPVVLLPLRGVSLLGRNCNDYVGRHVVPAYLATSGGVRGSIAAILHGVIHGLSVTRTVARGSSEHYTGEHRHEALVS